MINESDMHCYWWEEAPPYYAPAATWQNHSDIVIIGCGFTGVSAALTLARAGRDVVILEKGLIGGGASTRNGGITSGNIRLTEAQLAKKFGNVRAQLFTDESVAARADLVQFIKNNNIDCDYQLSGRLVGLSTSFSSSKMEQQFHEYERRYGISTKLVTKKEMADFTSSLKYFGGVYRPDIGGIHPAKLLREMVRLALEAGVKIFSNNQVLNIKSFKTSFTLKTAMGTITAQHLVSATNGYTDRAQPWLQRRLIPVISEIIATEKLGANRVKALMPRLNMFGEAKQLGFYYRPSPDGERILLGGRRMHKNSAKAKQRLQNGLFAIFPELADTKIDYHWDGYVAFPVDQLPKLTINDGIIYPCGFCGSGTVWARWLGQKAALMILGEQANSVFKGLPMKTLPLYHGDPWFLPLAIHYYNLRDKLSASIK
tara:strand:- start:9721 stop:11004 length:1284 start_codon:yes stop_codon:yes gene_type:complete